MEDSKKLTNRPPEYMTAALIALYEAKICPCCGAKLDFEPWSSGGRVQSDEICPCCDVQFGYTDFTGVDDLAGRIKIYKSIREAWTKEGMRWRHLSQKPVAWDANAQLNRIQNEA